MSVSMRNKFAFPVFFLCLLLLSCNIPSSNTNDELPSKPKREFLWNLDAISSLDTAISSQTSQTMTHPTATPQLIKAIDFETAFSESHSEMNDTIHEIHQQTGSGRDEARWLYFSPAEFSTGSFETLYAAFENSGESVWDQKYYLDFYAGANPSRDGEIYLENITHPGDQAVFEIPVKNEDPSWKACWQLKNAESEAFYDFCYSHGNGANLPQSASNNSSVPSSNSDVFWGFVRTEGTAPARFSNNELNGEFVSSSPAAGHTFKAYDHFEDLTVTFKNNGSTAWDSSYAVVFYSGYNWMHTNSFQLPGTVNPGETASVIMPMDIIEDNDRWVTCWYLSTPDGKNLADFCFNYYTSG